MSKVFNLRSIINGWGNLIFPSQAIETIAISRALKCAQCTHIEQSKFVEAIVDTVTNKALKQKLKKVLYADYVNVL